MTYTQIDKFMKQLKSRLDVAKYMRNGIGGEKIEVIMSDKDAVKLYSELEDMKLTKKLYEQDRVMDE